MLPFKKPTYVFVGWKWKKKDDLIPQQNTTEEITFPIQEIIFPLRKHFSPVCADHRNQNHSDMTSVYHEWLLCQ